MQRGALAITLISLLAGLSTAAAQSKVRRLTSAAVLTVETTQQTGHSPAGPAGNVFTTTLRLSPKGPVSGLNPSGTMLFSVSHEGSWECGTASTCNSTYTYKITARLPNGTLVAASDTLTNADLARNRVRVPIENGTGIFKGTTGSIDIVSPSGSPGAPYVVFTLLLRSP